MLKTRLFLFGGSLLVIWLIFQLPKSVVENETPVDEEVNDSVTSHIETHVQAPKEITEKIAALRRLFSESSQKEKNAIFADSLASLYRLSNRFDSAAWFAEESSKFFNNVKSWTQAGDDYYQAYSLALEQGKQQAYAAKTREFYEKVLAINPSNLEVKTKMAMTYMASTSPMEGIQMLMEVLRQDPQNQLALFNMGMLSIQSGQYDKAIERLERLVKINPTHLQGQLLLGIAWMNKGNTTKAREQFEKVKQMDKDPAVQATVDSYLKDLK
jgi:outer membrane protein